MSTVDVAGGGGDAELRRLMAQRDAAQAKKLSAATQVLSRHAAHEAQVQQQFAGLLSTQATDASGRPVVRPRQN